MSGLDGLAPRPADPGCPTRQASDLVPGDEVLLDLPGAGCVTGTVEFVEGTGSVKFGTTGPDAIPMVRVHFVNLPKPFAGSIVCAGDRVYEVEE